MIKPNNRASPEGNHTTALTGEKMQSPLWCRKAPKGESHRRWLITVVLIITYNTESKSRNADFISIAYGNPQPSAQRPRQTYESSGQGPVHLKNLFPQPFYTTCGASRAPFYKTCGEAATTTLGPKGPSNLRTFRTLGPKARQPSRRRRVRAPFYLQNVL